MEIEQSYSTYSLRRALLIYSDGSEESVVTEHPVHDGVIQPGAPVDLEATLRALPSEKAKAASPIKWSASPRLIAELPEYVVWWSPAKVRPVFIAGKPRKAWTPALIWCANRAAPTCYLFAFEGEDHDGAGGHEVAQTVEEGATFVFGVWAKVQHYHFGEGGVFDQIYKPAR